MRNWMKQLNRVIVLALMLVCLFGCLPMKASAYPTVYLTDGVYKWGGASGWQIVDSGGNALTNHWIKDYVDGKWYDYFVGGDGEAYTGWHKIQKEGSSVSYWHYFWPQNGRLAVGPGWVTIEGGKYYIDGGGYLLTQLDSSINGWICVDKSKNAYFYVNPSGDGGTIGKMQTGWVTTSRGKFYLTPVAVEDYQYGQMFHSSWRTIDKNQYHFQTNGVMDTYWYSDTNGTYYLGDNGVLRYGLQKNIPKVDGKEAGTYLFNTSTGKMYTNHWYKHSDGTWYYFGSDGRSITNKLIVKNEISGTSTPFKYRVTIWSGGSTREVIKQEEFELSHNGTKEFTNIPTNAIYTVEQITTPSGYVKNSGGASNATLNGDKTVTFKNTQMLTLTVAKDVQGALGQTGKEFTIVVNYTKPDNSTGSATLTVKEGSPQSVPNLPFGTKYTVKEPNVPSGYVSSNTLETPRELRTSETWTVINTQQQKTLKIVNATECVEEAKDTSFSYKVTVKYADNTTFLTKEISLLPGQSTDIAVPANGSYTIVQTAPDGYSFDTGKTVTRTGTIAQDVTETFTNKQLVTFKVTNNVVGEKTDFNYTVEIAGRDPYTLTLGKEKTSEEITGIPFNTAFKVTQSSHPGYTTTPESRVIEGNLTSEVTNADFTNTQKMFTLTVTNNVTGVDNTITYSVTVNGGDPQEITLGNNESCPIPNIPYGSSYTVNQITPDNYQYQVTKVDSGNGTLTDNATVTFTNIQLVDLTVTKVLEGVTAETGKEFGFVVDHTRPGESLVSSSFPLTGGNSYTFEDLPYGTTYTVTETADPGYTTAYSENAEGTLTADTTVTVTNTAIEYELVVGQKVIGTQVAQENDFFSFTLTWKRSGSNTEVTETFTLKHDQTAKFVLPQGCTYVVTQTEFDGYMAATIEGNASNTEGMVADHEVTFTNTQLVTLTVNAQVIGSMANEEQPFDFP